MMMGFDPDRQRVQEELALEQKFALAAADANPEKAIRLIKDSLTKGISSNVLSLLQKLNKNDSKKASELAGDVIKKLTDTDLSKSSEDMRAALELLRFAYKPKPAEGKDKPFAFTDAQVKDLANKIATAVLQPSRSMMSALLLSESLAMLEKFVPEKGALLRQRQSENESIMPPELKRIQQRQALFDPSSSAEDILAQLPKLTNEFDKMAAYEALTSKAVEMEDEGRAKKLIDQIPDEKKRSAALDQLESQRTIRTAKAGKLDEARKMIANITKKSIQIQRLVALALEFKKKDTEKDTAIALELMKDARGLAIEAPETGEQMNDLMEVVRGYAKVDPVIAFKLFEPTIGQFNELLDASAVLARFEPQYASFKKGELEMSINMQSWSLVIFRFIPQMQALAKADLEKMNAAADRFSRDDVRIMVRLYIIQGFLRDEKENEAGPRMDSFFMY